MKNEMIEKMNTVVGDAVYNVTGLRNMGSDEEPEEKVTSEIEPDDDDGLEDIPDPVAPVKKPKKQKKAPTASTTSATSAPAATQSTNQPTGPVGQRTEEFVLDLLRSEKDLRDAARGILAEYEEADKPDEFVWVYQMIKGPKKGEVFIGEEAAEKAIPEEVRPYVEAKDLFLKALHKVNRDGSVGNQASKSELEAYLAEHPDEAPKQTKSAAKKKDPQSSDSTTAAVAS